MPIFSFSIVFSCNKCRVEAWVSNFLRRVQVSGAPYQFEWRGKRVGSVSKAFATHIQIPFSYETYKNSASNNSFSASHEYVSVEHKHKGDERIVCTELSPRIVKRSVSERVLNFHFAARTRWALSGNYYYYICSVSPRHLHSAVSTHSRI